VALAPRLIGMETCTTAHYWARELTKLGHKVRPMPAKDVKAYLRRNKNDAADAAAICEAVRRPTMGFVRIKTAEQQGQMMQHRMGGFLQAIYCNDGLPLHVRMKAAITALPFEHPKLAVVATLGASDCASAIERSRQSAPAIVAEHNSVPTAIGLAKKPTAEYLARGVAYERPARQSDC
jgi:transposase